MKFKKIILILICLFSFNIIVFYKFIDFTPQNQLFHTNLSKISQPLIIDNNWNDLVNGGFCTGSGTYNDPYIIQNYIINGDGTASCIEIRNSNKFFKIFNCTLTNSQSFVYPFTHHAGILLINVTNGMILEVESSFNRGNGISLYDCRNITIRSSEFNNNQKGIYLYNSQNNTVSSNSINHNKYEGIYLSYCNTTTLVKNYVFNDHYGIFLIYCNNFYINS
ncbi:MAG: right-handed parallel beta-helix repeat-containing protein, partial [Candidatus Odinarchaeota archaeon]